MSELDIDAIKARLDGATPGPWDFYVLPQSVGITVATIHSEHGTRETCWTVDLPPEIGGMGTEKDAEFIAHAPEDIAALLTEVEQVRATIRVLTSERDGALSRNDSLIDTQEVVRRRIEEIHKPIDALNTSVNQIQQVCRGCGQDNGKWNDWPCPTIRALEAA